VRGDQALPQTLIDAFPYVHKDTSGVLSFAPGEETITLDMEWRIIDDFEATVFARLAPAQRNMLWVRHTHARHHELLFVTPRAAFTPDGQMKSLDIVPPGKVRHELFDTLRNLGNATYGLADPDDLARRRKAAQVEGATLSERIARVKGERSTAKTRNDIRLLIRDYVRE
jgi:hypothetical protein